MPLLENGVEIVKALLPPKDANDEAAQNRWRWTIFSAITALGVALTAHILLACGLVPVIYPGFALASDTTEIHHQINVIETISISNEILEESSKVCHDTAADQRLKLNEYIAKLQGEYNVINHQYLPVPECSAQ